MEDKNRLLFIQVSLCKNRRKYTIDFTDNGSEFAREWLSYCKREKIKVIKSGVQNIAHSALAERAIASVRRLVGRIKSVHAKWPGIKIVKTAVFLLNTSPHRSLYGQTSPMDLWMDEDQSTSVVQLEHQRLERLKTLAKQRQRPRAQFKIDEYVRIKLTPILKKFHKSNTPATLKPIYRIAKVIDVSGGGHDYAYHLANLNGVVLHGTFSENQLVSADGGGGNGG